MKKKLLIFGNGEIADLAFFYFSKQDIYDVSAFVVDDPKESKFNSIPLISKEDLSKFPKEEYCIHVALSYRNLNKNRQENLIFLKIKNIILQVMSLKKQQS